MSSQRAHYHSLEDRGVVVTGGATGIGAEVVRSFVDQGARVTILDVDEDAGSALCDELGTGLHRPVFIAADLLQVEAFDDIVAGIVKTSGHPSILVNNAANDQRHEMGSVTAEQWDWSMSVNLRHYFFMAQAIIPSMQVLGDGAIINLTSVTALNGSPVLPIYSAAKGAVITLTKTIARRYGADGIRCNAVAPGVVVTSRQRRLWVSEEKEREFISRQLIHEPVTAAAIADTVVFLGSAQARSITKQVIVVDGGLV
jgi:NAD(P)-dependent dehydrogenase (short-subunit alcohol dehydrogenase family)